jgi:DNA mismatch repair protein MutS
MLNGIKSEKMKCKWVSLDDPLLEDIKEEILSLDINTVTLWRRWWNSMK